MLANKTLARLRTRLPLVCLQFLLPLVAAAANRNDPAYILSLSWSPTFCAQSSHANTAECRGNRGFIVHGLWPEGSDSTSCDHQTRVSDDTLQRMLPIMGSRSLVIHEWRKHGACSGQTPETYFKTIETLWGRLHIPEPYSAPTGPFTASADHLRRDFVTSNPSFNDADIATVCRNGVLQEVRFCLDDKLNPNACATRRASCSGSIIVPAPAR